MGSRVTAPAVRAHKVASGADPLVMVTAYDAPGARMADDAGVDLILVGDSLAMVVLGYDDTLQVTVDDMAHHTAAVARAKPSALVVADLPWLSYHVSVEDTVRNAAQLVRAGAGAVKLEGGAKRVPVIEALVDAEIPVMGHIGLTPQSVHAMGGFKVQGKELAAARQLVDDAERLVEAGVFSIVLEGVPDVLTPASIAQLPILSVTNEWQARGSLLRWFTDNKVHFRNVTICNTFRTTASMAIDGLGIGQLPLALFRDEVRQGRLRIVPGDPEVPPLEIMAIRPLGDDSAVYLAIEKAALEAAADH